MLLPFLPSHQLKNCKSSYSAPTSPCLPFLFFSLFQTSSRWCVLLSALRPLSFSVCFPFLLFLSLLFFSITAVLALPSCFFFRSPSDFFLSHSSLFTPPRIALCATDYLDSSYLNPTSFFSLFPLPSILFSLCRSSPSSLFSSKDFSF